MAKNDILLPDPDDYGPFIRVVRWALNASETFAVGEPVYLNADGEVQESGDDPTPATFGGIALSSGDTARSSDPVGTFIRRVGQYQLSGDGHTPTTGDMVLVAQMLPGATIKCSNFATGGAGSPVTPTQANAIGEQAGFTRDGSGNYFIDTGCTNEPLVITDVLDANGESITFSGQAGVWVVATVVETQFSAQI